MNKLSSEINTLRASSRQLLREWGVLKLQYQTDITPTHAHALLEIHASDLTTTQLSETLILDVSTTSRIINKLIKQGYVSTKKSTDKRSKILTLTKKGQQQVAEIDRYSNKLICDAFEFLSESEQLQIIKSVATYANALEKSRGFVNEIEIKTLKKDKSLRNSIIDMITAIQTEEFNVNVDRSINNCILNAEKVYSFKNRCNFWYATDKDNNIIGCIGLKQINEHSAELKKCFVANAYRGKGLAQKLVARLIDQARKLDLQHIYLGTVKDFTWAHRFYQKFGFRKIPQKQLPKNFERCPADSVFFCGDVAKLITPWK